MIQSLPRDFSYYHVLGEIPLDLAQNSCISIEEINL